MKKKNVKSIIRLFVLGMFITLLMPTDMNAQRDRTRNNSKIKSNSKNSNRRGKVVAPARDYNKYPHRNARVNRVPDRSVAIRHQNNMYHYHNGTFYRPSNGAYIVTRAPLGLRVTILPPNPLTLHLRGRNYYYQHGTYYAPISNGGYEVIATPVGAIIDTLPDGYEVVDLEGRVYYHFEDTYYKALLDNNGRVVYEVVRV